MDKGEIVSVAEDLTEDAMGDSVTDQKLANNVTSRLAPKVTNEAPVAYLLEGEQPHFLFQLSPFGKATVAGQEADLEFDDFEIKGGGWFVTTDMRVLVIVNAGEQDEEISIPLSEIESINYKSKMMGGGRVTIETDKFACEFISTQDVSDSALEYIRDEDGVHQSDLKQKTSLIETESVLVCKKCGEEVSKNAKKCPHCDYYPGGGGKGALWHATSLFVWPMAVKGAADEVRSRRGIAEEKRVQAKETSGEDAASHDPLDTLERLGELRDQGVVTQEEFARKKEELLDKL